MKHVSRCRALAASRSVTNANEWETNTEREWKLWSESVDCHAGRKLDFKGIQRLTFLSTLMSGDCFALLPQIDRGNPINLSLQILEADQCSTPFSVTGQPNIKDGVEVDGWGAPIAYHFATTHPGSPDLTNKFTWKRVPAFGEKTNRRNVLHLFDMERPGQKRGIPFLSPVVESLKQFGRYTEAELMAAVISGMFTAFITTPEGDKLQLDNATGQADTAPDISMGSGATVPLQAGEDIKFANPTRPNSQFGDFGKSVLRQVGAALDIPYEILAKEFNSSFSASRAALLEAWKFFNTSRVWLATGLCQPTYNEFLYEAVARGRIPATGFFSDLSIRKAYSIAKWIGPSAGMIDEVKAVTAAAMRVENNFSTRADESAKMNGSDFEENASQLSKEKKVLEKEGLKTEMTTTKAELNQDEEEDENSQNLKLA